MDETVSEIEAHIDRTRGQLGSHLNELEAKVSAATDWREHFRDRPYQFLGAAFVGGGILAAALRTKSAPRPTHSGSLKGFADSGTKAQVGAFWNNIEGALIGVATARIKDYVSAFLPDFDEHYRRAETVRSRPSGE